MVLVTALNESAMQLVTPEELAVLLVIFFSFFLSRFKDVLSFLFTKSP